MSLEQRQVIDRPVGGFAAAEIVVQRSRFCAEAHRVDTEDDARRIIAEIRQRDHDARHHCTAFVIGSIQRSNDDGEPSGTAGRPILDHLTGRGLDDVLVVVTRWFGGVLLGTGGLTRAYGDAAAAVLDEVGVRRQERWRVSRARVPLAISGVAEHRLRQRGEVLAVVHGPEQAAFDVAHPTATLDNRIDGVEIDIEPLDPVWRDLRS